MRGRMDRRSFLKGLTGGLAFLTVPIRKGYGMTQKADSRVPMVLCSRGEKWGREVTNAGWEALSRGGSVLDAVEQGATVVELDPEDMTVGYGGLPNEEGIVELDASIMYGPTHDCGAVAALRNIRTPTSVARRVMERSDHMMLVGKGALRFALAHGFKEEELLTESARLKWLEWKENLNDEDDWFPPQDGKYEEKGGRSHGTINVLAIDGNGDIAGVTSTSGLSFKIPGRVGDSAIIGAGLYVDNEVGAAGATGRGEEVIRTCSTFSIVEMMRRGMTPQEACEAACRRIIDINGGEGAIWKSRINDKFIAINKKGEVGCAMIFGSSEKPPQMSYRNGTGFHIVTGSILIEYSL